MESTMEETVKKTDINAAHVLGTVHEKPILRFTPSDLPVTRFELVTTTPRQQDNGETQFEVVRHYVVVFGPLAMWVSDEVSAGDRLDVGGQMKTSFLYRDNAGPRFITDVIADVVEKVEG